MSRRGSSDDRYGQIGFLIRTTSMLIQKSYDAPNHIKIPISSISKFDENLPFEAKNYQFQNICALKIAFIGWKWAFLNEKSIMKKIFNSKFDVKNDIFGQKLPFFNTKSISYLKPCSLCLNMTRLTIQGSLDRVTTGYC